MIDDMPRRGSSLGRARLWTYLCVMLIFFMAPDASVFEMLRPVYDALIGGHYALTTVLVVLVIVGLLRKFASPGSWIFTNPGGTALAMVFSMASALAVTLAAPGVAVSLAMLKSAFMVGVGAAGGFAVLKNLLIDPVLRPLAAKAPAWLQPIFSVVFYIFDKPDPVVVATTAGAAAVAAAPGEGVSAVAGQPTDIK